MILTCAFHLLPSTAPRSKTRLIPEEVPQAEPAGATARQGGRSFRPQAADFMPELDNDQKH